MSAAQQLLVKEDKRFILPPRFQHFRKEQLQFAEQAFELLSSGSADVVVMEGPVGFGKSLFAEMVRQLLKIRMLMVVPRIDLQEQFLDSFSYSRLLQGRSNFPHGGPTGRRDYPQVTCADCKKKFFCEDSGCEYKEAKAIFEHAGVGVTNLSYFLAAANYLKMFKPDPKKDKKLQNRESWSGDYLTTFDEADVIEDSLLDFLGAEVNMAYVQHVLEVTQMDRKLKILPAPVTNFARWFEWLGTILEILRACLKRYGEPNPEDVREVRWHTRLVKNILSLEQVKPDWVYDPDREEGKAGRKTGAAWKIVMKPKMVGELGAAKLWNHTGKVLAMSGTIINLETWMEETGLNHTDKKVEFLRYDSPWDRWRRTIHRVPGIRMVKEDRSKSWKEQSFWDEYIGNIASILLRYPYEKCLIHAVSHELARDIGDSLTEIFGDRIVTERGEKVKFDQDDTLEEREEKLKKAGKLNEYLRKPGAVLVSARLGRGTDLKDWRCRNIILAKTPYAFLGDRRIKARKEETESGELWYKIKAVREIIQYFGRGMRHEGDWVRIWVMDDTFDGIVSLQGLLPKYFRLSIRPPGDYMSRWPALEDFEIGDIAA